MSTAQLRAMQWIEQNMKLLSAYGDPYELAIVAYALMLSKAPSANYAFDMLNTKMRLEGPFSDWNNITAVCRVVSPNPKHVYVVLQADLYTGVGNRCRCRRVNKKIKSLIRCLDCRTNTIR